MTVRGLVVGTALVVGLATGVRAQKVVIRFDGIGLTYQEISEGRGQALGAGAGVGIVFRFKRVRLDFRGSFAEIKAPGAGGVNFNFRQVDSRFGYYLTEFLALEVGAGRRRVSPEFAAPDVGLVRFGVLSENQLHRQAMVWVRGAYVINPGFNTGGTATMAFEFGLGVSFGSSSGKFRVQAEYEFQRIDRVVAGAAVPMQMSLARTGFAIGF